MTSWEDNLRSEYDGSIAKLPTGDTHYKLFGETNTTAPLIVFIHGFGLHSAIYYNIAEEIAAEKSYRTLIFDNYGRGKSATPNIQQTPDLFDTQLWSLIKHIGVPDTEKVTLVGLSMGAAISIIASGRHPERIRSLVAIVPPGLISTPLDCGAKLIMTPYIGYPFYYMFGRMAMKKRWESGLSLRSDFHDHISHPVMTKKYQSMIEKSIGNDGFIWSIRNTYMNFPLQDMKPHVEKLGKAQAAATAEGKGFPITVVLAKFDTTCPPAPDVWAKLVPAATIAWIQTGHMCLWEDYPETKKIVLASI
eukprot:PhF_6_TR2196/c0_g2_i3/m.3644